MRSERFRTGLKQRAAPAPCTVASATILKYFAATAAEGRRFLKSDAEPAAADDNDSEDER